MKAVDYGGTQCIIWSSLDPAVDFEITGRPYPYGMPRRLTGAAIRNHAHFRILLRKAIVDYRGRAMCRLYVIASSGKARRDEGGY